MRTTIRCACMLACVFLCAGAFGAEMPKAPGKPDPLPAGAVARFGAVRFHHGVRIRCHAYSPGGKLLAVADVENRNSRGISLWDAETGRTVRTLRAGDRGFFHVAFTEGGKTLVSLGRDNVVRGWDPSTGKEKWQFKSQQRSHRFVASARGKWLILWTHRGIQLWDLQTRKIVRNLGAAHLAAISADGTRAVLSVAVDRAREIRLLEIPSGKQLRLLVRTTSAVANLAMSEDGKQVAVSVMGVGVQFWNAETGKHVATLTIPGNRASLLTFSPDGKLLAAIGGDGRLRVWKVAGKDEPFTPTVGYPRGGIAFSADSRILVVGDGGTVRRWDLESGKELFLQHGHSGTINALAFAPGSAFLATAGADATVRIWDVAGGGQLRKLVGHEKRVVSVAYSRDGKTLATGAADMRIILWDPTGRKAAEKLDTADDLPAALAFGPDGRTLRAAGAGGGFAIWDLAAKKQTIIPPKVRRAISAFSHDGALLAAGAGNLLSVWNAGNGTLRNSARVPLKRPLRACALESCGQFVLWGGQDAFGLIEISSGKEVSRGQGSTAWRRSGAVAFSPGGRIFAAGGDDGLVGVYDSVTKKKLREFRGHAGFIVALAFSDDGKLLASASSDTTAIVWSMANVKLPRAATRPAGDDETMGRLWSDLASAEAAVAYQAIWRLIERKDAAVGFLAARLSPARAPDAQQVQQLITQLDDREYTVRSKAQEDLGKLGWLVEAVLRAALNKTESLEAGARITLLLKRLEPPSTLQPKVQSRVRAVYVLERIGTASAGKVLVKLAAGAADAPQTQAAASALRRLNRGR